MHHLFQFVEPLRADADTDFYEMWCIVNLIDSCVGNESLNQGELVGVSSDDTFDAVLQFACLLCLYYLGSSKF